MMQPRDKWVASRSNAILIVALTASVVSLPLFWGRVLSGSDIVTYLIYAQQTAANLREGLVFPAWGGGFNSGFGAPGLLFYPPLTSYVHALPVLMGVPVIFGVEGLTVLALILSGLIVWWWLISAGWRSGALPAACVYLIAPYRFVDIYSRSALSEHWAFIWPPLILMIATDGRIRTILRIPLLALAVAGLLLTNLPLALLFGIGLGVWFFFSDRLAGRRPAVIMGTVLGFALAAFQLVPQALSSHLLDVDRYYGPSAGKFKASANTLFASGFDSWRGNVENSACLLVTFILLVVAFLLLSKAERSRRSSLWILVASTICLLASTSVFGPIWDGVPVLSRIQFPWRLSAVMTLLLTGLAARLTPPRTVAFLAVAFIAAIPFNGWNRTAPAERFLPAEKPSVSADSPGIPNAMFAWEAGSTGWYWRHHTLAEIWLIPNNAGEALFADLAGRFPPEFDHIRGRPAVLLEDPSSPFEIKTWGQTAREIEVDAAVEGTVVWRALYFPDMHVTVDDSPTELTVEPETGLVSLRVPEGEHALGWSWSPFGSLVAARHLTLSAIVSVLALLFAAAISRVRRDRANSHNA